MAEVTVWDFHEAVRLLNEEDYEKKTNDYFCCRNFIENTEKEMGSKFLNVYKFFTPDEKRLENYLFSGIQVLHKLQAYECGWKDSTWPKALKFIQKNPFGYFLKLRKIRTKEEFDEFKEWFFKHHMTLLNIHQYVEHARIHYKNLLEN